MEEEMDYEGIKKTIGKDKIGKTLKNGKGNNNLDIIEDQLKFEYKKEEIIKNKAYNQLTFYILFNS